MAEVNSPIGILIVAFIGAAVTYAVGYRNGAAQAEARAEHEVMQAVLWADDPLQVAEFYAGFRPDPPEDVNPDDEVDEEAIVADIKEADPTALAHIRPPVPGATPEAGILLMPTGTPAELDWAPDTMHPEPGAPTSHRAMRRPFIGWLDDTFTALTNRLPWRHPGVELPDNQPDCARCNDAGRLDDPTISYGWRPCPDCCCPEPGCGLHTGGGLCTTHRDADDLREEAAAKRGADL